MVDIDQQKTKPFVKPAYLANLLADFLICAGCSEFSVESVSILSEYDFPGTDFPGTVYIFSNRKIFGRNEYTVPEL